MSKWGWWDKEAGRLQTLTIESEAAKQHLYPYTPSEVRTATIHLRQDVVLLVAHISALNRQLSWAVSLLSAIFVILACIAYELWR